MTTSNTVLITGTSTGFGRLAAEHLAREGHKVFATMRGATGKNQAAADELNALTGEGLDITVLELDVTSAEDIAAVVSAVEDSAGSLDVLVNNAGMFGMGPVEAYTSDQFRFIMETNVIGLHAITRAFLPMMRAAKSGLVINVSSVVGRLTMPGGTLYTSTKYAVEALTEGYRYETKEHGIDFVLIEPEAYGTDIFGKTFDPEDADVATAYPEFMATLAQLGEAIGETIQAEDANDPAEFGRVLSELIGMVPGTRPLRRPMGKDLKPMMDGLNGQIAEAQRGFLTAFGYTDYVDLAE